MKWIPLRFGGPSVFTGKHENEEESVPSALIAPLLFLLAAGGLYMGGDWRGDRGWRGRGGGVGVRWK